MNCPYCNSPSGVLETRTRKDQTVRRTRLCTRSHKFTTEEAVFQPVVGANRTIRPGIPRGMATLERRKVVRDLIDRGLRNSEVVAATGAALRTVQRMRARP